MAGSDLSRRGFLAGTAAGGLLLALTPSGKLVLAQPEDPKATFRYLAWIEIAPDGAVTITAHRSEMGQGSKTSLPLVIADELGADWSRVSIRQADGDARYGSQNTDGSRSVRNNYTRMRRVGAAAREMMIAAVAKTWRVRASKCTARDHMITGPGDKSIPFGDAAVLAAGTEPPDADKVPLKKKSELRYIGKSFSVVDLDEIVTGKAVYGHDVRLDGMKYAVIARPPVYGGEPAKIDTAAAEKVPGVERVIEIPVAPVPAGMNSLGGVAVIANSTWAAMRGRAALEIEWKDGANARFDSAAYRKKMEETARAPQKVVRQTGDAPAALEKAAKTIEADYYLPMLSHAPMETPAATARPTEDGGIEIWAPTQAPQGAQGQVAAILGLDAEKVTVHVTLLGGGFGRKSKPDFIVEAARLAKELGAPVKVTWSRADDVRHGYFHASAALHFEGGLDEDGKTTALLARTVFPPIGSTFAPTDRAGDGELGLGFTDLPYAIPNLRMESGPAKGHVRIGWYRSVSNIHHAFATCSFADELAHAAGKDPYAYLLELLGAPRKLDPNEQGAKYTNYGASLDEHPIDTARHRGVLERAAEKAGWGKKLPARHGMGIAVHRSFLCYVAAAVECQVTPDGALRIPRVTMSVDAGTVVNPDRVRSQMEGAAIMALGNTIHGKITAAGGRIEQQNYTDYPVLRMHESPAEIEVDIVRSDAPPAGIGEPGVPPVGPALCNAIFAATGKRIRSLPIREHDLRTS